MTLDYTNIMKFPVSDGLQSPWHSGLDRTCSFIDRLTFAEFDALGIRLWQNSTVYTIGKIVINPVDGQLYSCGVAHTSTAAPQTFIQELAAHPTFWSVATPAVATIEEAIAGIENTHYMTAERTRDAILALSPPIGIASRAQAEAGVDNAAVMTPLDTRFSRMVHGSSGRTWGCQLGNNAGNPTINIDIGAGEATTADGQLIILPAATVKTVAGAWAPGVAGAYDGQAVVTNSSWYYVHLIYRPDLDTTDVLTSLNPTAPTLPLNYTKSKRIGCVYRNSGGSISAFTQRGDEFVWTVAPVQDVNYTGSGTSAVLRTLTVPPITGIQAMLRVLLSHPTSAGILLITSPLQSDQGPNVPTGNCTIFLYSAGAQNALAVGPYATVSGQIRDRNGIAGAAVSIVTVGWLDSRIS